MRHAGHNVERDGVAGPAKLAEVTSGHRIGDDLVGSTLRKKDRDVADRRRRRVFRDEPPLGVDPRDVLDREKRRSQGKRI